MNKIKKYLPTGEVLGLIIGGLLLFGFLFTMMVHSGVPAHKAILSILVCSLITGIFVATVYFIAKLMIRYDEWRKS